MTIPRNDMISSGLEAGMKQEGAIELPFPTPYFWAINGKAALKATGGAAYYGGFVCKAEQLEDVVSKTDRDIPAYLQLGSFATREGDEYEGYGTRVLSLVPIASRDRWLIKQDKGGGYKLHFDRAAFATTQHIQVLCYLAAITDKHYVPWGPVVVSAKGYQAKYLNDALKQWSDATAKIRAQIAPGWPANAFWQSIGNFGDKPLTVMVGSEGAKSPISPIALYLPSLTDEVLEKSWIGTETAQECNRLREEAQEWLGAWKAGLEQNQNQGNPVVEGDSGEGPNPFPF